MINIDEMTPFEALDHVKSIRASYRACIGSLYKNVAVNMMQDFLERCVSKWGERFMECVKREKDEEIIAEHYMNKSYGDKGRRELVFPDVIPEWVKKVTNGRYRRG